MRITREREEEKSMMTGSILHEEVYNDNYEVVPSLVGSSTCLSRATYESTKCQCEYNVHTSSAKSPTHFFYLFFIIDTKRTSKQTKEHKEIQNEAISKENF